MAEHPERAGDDARLARGVLARDAPGGRVGAAPGPRRGPSAAPLPIATIALIAASAIAYLLAIRGGGSLLGGPSEATLLAYGAIPYELTHGGSHCALSLLGTGVLCTGQRGVIGAAGAQPPTWETVVTSIFVSAGLLRLCGTMVLLACFAWPLERALGRPAVVATFLLGGLVGLGATVAAAPDSTAPALGASGAVCALAGAHAALCAERRGRTAAIVVALLALLELPSLAGLGAAALRSGAATVLYAHLAALAAGVLAAAGARAWRGAQVEAARIE